MLKRTMLATAVAFGITAAPATAQQSGLVNVNISDIEVELQDVISDNNINVQAPITANVQVPIGIAAAICDVNANVLAQQLRGDGAECTATNETTSEAELLTLARSLQRQ